MADTDNTQICKLLITAAGTIARIYRNEQRRRGEDFNIFSILKYERKEVETHSAFLYELLRKDGSHDYADLFLKLFLEAIEFKEETVELKCKREVIIPDRRIDFVIEDEKRIIIIEMKVDTKDSENQLNDYWKYGQEVKEKSGKTPHYYYLTLNGDRPVNASKKVKDAFTPISFAKHIRAFIQKAIRECDSENIRLALQHYLKVVDNITGQISKGEIMEIEGLINGAEAAMGAFEVYRSLPDILAKKELEFWDSVAKEIDRDIIEKYPRRVHDTSFEKVESGSYTKPIREAMLAEIKDAQASSKYYGLFFAIDLDKTRSINLDFYVDSTKPNLRAKCPVYKEGAKNYEVIAVDFPEELRLKGKGNAKYKYFDKELYLPRNMKTDIDPKWAWLFDEAEMQNQIDSTAKEINSFLALYKKHEAKVIEAANSAKK
ncbi:hypothetical protein FACS1894103_0090 [Campylobacterota bacterium]|nr:hypothetical protein FACS1894103_0090 [Campylobacterota bacterium]